MTTSRHARTSLALAVLTAVLLAAAGIAGYARSELHDTTAFSQRVAGALDDGAVRSELADRAVDGLAAGVTRNVLIVRPALTAAIAAIAGTDAFRAAFTRGLADQHSALFGARSRVVLDLEGVGAMLLAATRTVSPRLARQLPRDPEPTLVALDDGDVRVQIARALDDVSGWAWPLFALALLAAAGCAALAGGVRNAVASLGAAVTAGGLTIVLIVTALGTVVVTTTTGGSGERLRDVVRAVWSAVFGDLRTIGLVAALAGAVVAGVAIFVGKRRASEEPIAEQAVTVSLLTLVSVVAGVLATTAAGIAIALPAPGTQPTVHAATNGGCNGLVRLCARRLDEVVFPTTHNSFAASDEPGWLFPNQRFGIARQLKDGIRGLLIDIHYGQRDPATGNVRTDLAAEGSDRNKVAQELGPGALQAADRIAGSVGRPLPTGHRGLYLCHTLCELGSEPLGQELGIIRRFLDTHPREVLIVFVEPYVPAEKIAKAFDDAGLGREAVDLRLGVPLPTLGRLIRADTRLVVLAEEDGGEPPWYLKGFDFVQDTPYRGVSEHHLVCTRFRGRADSPLLLVNHWTAAWPPAPNANARIGGEVLRDRLERCEQERKMLPNLVAVDFYEDSGVVAIARDLNRGR